MSDFSSLALSRRSIRKFENKDIPFSEVEEFIKIATSAPSGCNSQCWRFIAIKDKTVIENIRVAIINKIDVLLESKKEDLDINYLTAKRKVASFFVNAPVVVAVFLTRMEHSDATFISILKEKGYSDEGIMELFAYPDLLSVGAAIQNLLLAVHEKGYGACWMNEPALASSEISKILDVPTDNRLLSLIPIGVPAYNPREKKMKDFNEVFQSI